MADCYGMTSVCREVEWQAERHLTVDRAAELLTRAVDGGLIRVRAASRKLALSQFESFAATAGFMGLDGEELGALLDEGCVEAEGEEQVLEAVARWIRGGGADQQLRGEGLLRKIKFDAMGTRYLSGAGRAVLPGSTLLGELMEAALAHRSMGAAGEGRPEASRGPVAIRWGQYARAGQGAAMLAGEHPRIMSVAVCRVRGEDRACWGTSHGQILVTKREGAALKTVKTLHVNHSVQVSDYSEILQLAAWMGLVVSGNNKGVLRLWDIDTGNVTHCVQAHDESISALAVCCDGNRLVSASRDGKVSLWAAGTEAHRIALLRTRVFEHAVRGMVSMGGSRLAVGCANGVVVWDTGRSGTGPGTDSDEYSADRRLDVCKPSTQLYISINEGLQALTSDGRHLVGTDGRKLEVWAVDGGRGGGVLVKAVEAYAADSLHRVQSLAMHAGKLVTGSRIRQGELACEVCVRDVTTLLVEHVLGGESFRWRGIYTAEVRVLLAERGRVWGGVCQGALMWGYDDIMKTSSATATDKTASRFGTGLLIQRLTRSCWP